MKKFSIWIMNFEDNKAIMKSYSSKIFSIFLFFLQAKLLNELDGREGNKNFLYKII